MPDPAPGAALLAREADIFARYLAGAAATPYQAERYAAGQAALPPTATAFDEAQLALARTHPVLTRAADAYGRLLAPRSLLRHKLVLMLAVLESSAPSHRAFAPAGASAAAALARLVLAGGAFAVALALGVAVCGPLHLGTALGALGRR